MRSKETNQKKIMMRIIKTPIRVLCKARDFYIRSITNCANHSTYGQVGGLSSALPRSFSTSSYGSHNYNESEDLRELIRANTTSGAGISRAKLELYMQKHMMMKQASSMTVDKVPRSVSVGVGMGKIDEEASGASSFREDDTNTNKSDWMCPRSKSFAVTKGSVGF